MGLISTWFVDVGEYSGNIIRHSRYSHLPSSISWDRISRCICPWLFMAQLSTARPRAMGQNHDVPWVKRGRWTSMSRYVGPNPRIPGFWPIPVFEKCLIWLRNVMATEWDYFSDFMGSISSIDIWVCSKTVGPVLPSNTVVNIAIMNLACLWWYRIYPSWYGDTQSCAWPATALLHHWPLAGRGAQVGTWIGPRSKEPQIGLSVGSSNGLWQEGLTRMRMGRRSILWPASSLSPSAPS